MADARSQARNSVEELVSAWLAGDHAAVSRACIGDVRWWTPLRGETVTGVEALFAELEAIRRLSAQPLAVTALAVNDNGTTAVVEMRSDAIDVGERPSFVTSVLTLTAGKVAEGRTYVDVQTHEQRRGATS